MIQLLTLLLLAGCAPSSDSLTLRIALPSSTPDSARVYVAGTFNGWNPADPAFELDREGDSAQITFASMDADEIAFKFTLGSWESGETQGGFDAPNRTIRIVGGPQVYASSVEEWRSGSARLPSTASASVSLMDSAFAMPQLERARRVQVWLPPGYSGSDRRYPVLYVHDGQNVFDAATTSYGTEWRLDETLDSLRAQVIVIAVDHGFDRRMDEYSPFANGTYGGGEGEAYVAFLAETLKPHVDARFRTLPDPEHTGILGSSMGGLISLYAGLTRPDVFGRVGVFSPSLWFAEEQMLNLVDRADLSGSRLYFVSAESEGPGIVDTQPRMVDRLQTEHPGLSLESYLRSYGDHSEGFWAGEFAQAFEWLFRE